MSCQERNSRPDGTAPSLRLALAALALIPLLPALAGAQACNPDPIWSLSAMSTPTTIVACPAGDGDVLAAVGSSLGMTIIDVNGLPCPFQVSGLFEIDANPPGTLADAFDPLLLEHDLVPGGFQNQGGGNYQFYGGIRAGGHSTGAGCLVKAQGVAIAGNPIALEITSPDLNGDGFVNLVDVTRFSQLFFNAAYDWVIDYNKDGVESLQDVVVLAQHMGHQFAANYVIDPVD